MRRKDISTSRKHVCPAIEYPSSRPKHVSAAVEQPSATRESASNRPCPGSMRVGRRRYRRRPRSPALMPMWYTTRFVSLSIGETV